MRARCCANVATVYLQGRSQVEVQFTFHSNSPVPATPGNQVLSMNLTTSDMQNRACPLETDLLNLVQCPQGLHLLHPCTRMSILSINGRSAVVQKTCMLTSGHPPVDPNSALNRACVFGRSCSQVFRDIGQVCVSYLSRCCHKNPSQTQLKERRLTLACGLRRDLAHHDGKYGNRTMREVDTLETQDGEV